MSYNLSGMLEAQNLVEFAVGTNTIMGGYWFGYFVLGLMFIVPFLVMKFRGIATAGCMAGALWSMFMVALFLLPMGLIDIVTFWSTVLLVGAFTFVLYVNGGSN